MKIAKCSRIVTKCSDDVFIAIKYGDKRVIVKDKAMSLIVTLMTSTTVALVGKSVAKVQWSETLVQRPIV